MGCCCRKAWTLDLQGRTVVGDVSDEMLTLAMAVADGEASLNDERKLQAALAGDPALASQFAAFRTTGRGLGRMFDQVMAAPVPDRLVQAIAAAPMARVRPAGLLSRVGARWADLLSSWEVPALALGAAAIAFIAGGVLLGRPAADGLGATQVAALGALAPTDGLVEALAKVSTGAEQTFDTKAGALKVRVVETFRDQAGAPCREFEAQAASGPRQFGVACHSTAGWQLKAVFVGPARTGGTVVAGPGQYGELLDTVASAMRNGDALSADEERKLIGAGW